MHHKITKYISASVKCVTLFIASKTAVRDSVDLVCIKGPWLFSDLGQFCALPFCHNTHAQDCKGVFWDMPKVCLVLCLFDLVCLLALILLHLFSTENTPTDCSGNQCGGFCGKTSSGKGCLVSHQYLLRF